MNTNINMTNKEYSDFVDTKAEKSTIGKNIFFAFVIGGLICVIGQIIKNTMLLNYACMQIELRFGGRYA